MTYKDGFAAAVERTRRLGLPVPDVDLGGRPPCLRGPELQDVVERFGFTGPDDVAKRCNLVSQHLLEPLASALDCEAFLTIGDVRLEGSSLFGSGMSEQNIEAYLTRTNRPASLPFAHHAWVTFASLEILDLTIWPFIAETASGMSELYRDQISRRIVAGAGDGVHAGLTFHPMLIGDTFYSTCEPTYASLLAKFAQEYPGRGTG